jgi:DNA primase
VLKAILRRFKRVLVCFDRDVAGVKYLRKISLKTGLEPILVHKKFKAKDISDAIKLNGFETIKKWLYDTIGIQ